MIIKAGGLQDAHVQMQYTYFTSSNVHYNFKPRFITISFRCVRKHDMKLETMYYEYRLNTMLSDQTEVAEVESFHIYVMRDVFT